MFEAQGGSSLDYYTPGMNGTEFVDQLHTLWGEPLHHRGHPPPTTPISSRACSPGGAGLSCQAFPVPPLPSGTGSGPVPSGQAGWSEGPAAWTRAPLTSWSITGRRHWSITGTPLDKGVNFSTLSRIRRFFDERTRSTSLPANRSRRTCGPVLHHGTPLCQLHGGSGEITSSIDYQTGGRPSIRAT